MRGWMLPAEQVGASKTVFGHGLGHHHPSFIASLN
jgi:hypothetical protein